MSYALLVELNSAVISFTNSLTFGDRFEESVRELKSQSDIHLFINQNNNPVPKTMPLPLGIDITI